MNVEKLIETHRPRMERTIRKIIKNPSLADDIFQDASIKIFRYFSDSTKALPENMEAWITILSKNTAYDHLRKLKRTQDAVSHASEELKRHGSMDSETPERAFLSKEMMLEVKEVFQSLDQETKNILILRNQGHSYDEIASVLNITLAKVKTRVFRGRKKLLEALKSKGVL
ncbi:RNA polymerase sigma factor [Metabacillus sp. SLBN-84]